MMTCNLGSSPGLGGSMTAFNRSGFAGHVQVQFRPTRVFNMCIYQLLSPYLSSMSPYRNTAKQKVGKGVTENYIEIYAHYIKERVSGTGKLIWRVDYRSDLKLFGDAISYWLETEKHLEPVNKT